MEGTNNNIKKKHFDGDIVKKDIEDFGPYV